ncbi:MAG: hypothetical protein ACRDPF_18315 [Streptosporangiaceae bacterium]
MNDFDDLVRRHRRELHVHCYRMLRLVDIAAFEQPAMFPASACPPA